MIHKNILGKDLLNALWLHRDFILGNVKRNYQSRYRRSILGATWTVIQPLSMIVIYTLVFSQIMHARLPGVEGGMAYSIFLCSGILIWNFFSEIANKCQNVFLDNAEVIKKIKFPRLCLVVVIIVDSVITLSIFMLLFFTFLVLSGNFPGLVVLSFIPVVLVLLLFVVGLGICVGVLNVFFRDVGQLFQIILQFWFWLTPIVYPIHIIPEHYRFIFSLNPMTTIVTSSQQIFVYGRVPDYEALGYVAVLSLALCMLALRLYRRRCDEMVEEL
jgi:lipopolysaccharide transport system permease protein